jgi:hypothetical protein
VPVAASRMGEPPHVHNVVGYARRPDRGAKSNVPHIAPRHPGLHTHVLFDRHLPFSPAQSKSVRHTSAGGDGGPGGGGDGGPGGGGGGDTGLAHREEFTPGMSRLHPESMPLMRAAAISGVRGWRRVLVCVCVCVCARGVWGSD